MCSSSGTSLTELNYKDNITVFTVSIRTDSAEQT